jgi:hypothetical protein
MLNRFKRAASSPTSVTGNKKRKVVLVKQPDFVAEVIEISWKSGFEAARNKTKIVAPHWKKGVAVEEEDKPHEQKYASGSMRPGVYLVKSKKDADTFTVKLSVTKSEGQDPTGKLTGQLETLRFEGDCPTSVGEHVVKVKIVNLPDTVEHVDGDAKWSVKTAQGEFPQRDKTRLELFFVLDRPPAFYVQGPWVEALRFVFKRAKIGGSSDPIFIGGRISKYCHGGHGMRYDVLQGRSAFGGHHYAKAPFQLMSYMNWKTLPPGLVTPYGDKIQNVVNCYDQAAAVQALAGVVGVKAIWVFANPYGYIKQSNLVGVGACNNPFFKSPGATITPVTTADDPARTPFGNHAFVQLNDKSGGILDACAGPHTGKESIVEYIANAVDGVRSLTYFDFVRDLAANVGKTPKTGAEYCQFLADEKALYRPAAIPEVQ